MRIAIASNAPWTPTGYGQQVAELAPKLKEAGNEVAVLANYGLAGTSLEWNGIPVLPQGIDGYSNDITPAQIANFIGDGVGFGLTLFDVWVYKAPQWDTLPLLSWTPIDHSPVPEEVRQFFTRGGTKYAVAMSRFGEKELLNAGIARDKVFYAPHSINTSVFAPGASTMRSKMQLPEGAHVSMINAANKGTTPIRKSFGEMLLAWSRFAARHEDAYLYLHTEALGLANGINFERLIAAVKAPIDRIRIVPQYEYRMGIPNSTVADLYRAADVLLSASRGEGFGLCVLEAQACGVPVIVTDWTAQPELLGAGWKIDGELDYDPYQNSFWKIPSTDGIVDALEASYALKGNTEEAKKASETAVQFASQYETGRVFTEHWSPILKTAEEIFRDFKRGPIPANREARRAAMRGKK